MPVSDWDRASIDEILAGKGDWFTAKLLRLIRDADFENRKKLRQVFPEEVELVEAWQTGQLIPADAGWEGAGDVCPNNS